MKSNTNSPQSWSDLIPEPKGVEGSLQIAYSLFDGAVVLNANIELQITNEQIWADTLRIFARSIEDKYMVKGDIYHVRVLVEERSMIHPSELEKVLELDMDEIDTAKEIEKQSYGGYVIHELDAVCLISRKKSVDLDYDLG